MVIGIKILKRKLNMDSAVIITILGLPIGMVFIITTMNGMKLIPILILCSYVGIGLIHLWNEWYT